jgi:hypothetical protein
MSSGTHPDSVILSLPLFAVCIDYVLIDTDCDGESHEFSRAKTSYGFAGTFYAKR